MTETIEKPNNNKKKLPLTAGTAMFIFASFLLVMGFCKFSFYVLKNHRSAVSRDSFVQAYVDVQPYSGMRKNNTASYVIIKDTDTDNNAPAFFYKHEETKQAAVKVKEPISEKQVAVNTAPAPEFKRPPVIIAKAEPIKIESEIAQNNEKPVKIAEEDILDADDTPVSLESLMLAGQDVLDAADRAVLASEELLIDEELVVAEVKKDVPTSLTEIKKEVEPVSKPLIVAETKALEKEQKKATVIAQPVSGKKVQTAGEHWVDIEALRRSIAAEKAAEANATFMGNETKVAALSMTETDSVAVVQDIPYVGTEEPIKTAVVQDVPYVGTDAAPQQTAKAEKPASPFLTKEEIDRTNIAVHNPWKVAKVAGKAKNALAVVEDTPKNEAIKAIQKLAAETEERLLEPVEQGQSTETASAVIYKNGRLKKIYGETPSDAPAPAPSTPQPTPEKSLNWLDRQEAAVWTSLSQSDAPSVWASNDNPSRASDTAKAFRVAAEEAEPNEIKSAPVRTVGEEVKPEPIANPTLLPMIGSNAVQPTSAAPAVSKQAPAGLFAPIAPVAVTGTAPAEKELETKDPKDPSLVNKLFSMFGKSETAPSGSMPSLGGTSGSIATPAQTESVKKSIATTENVKSAPKIDNGKQILPAEIRLTFKPDSSEISAQSIKWIKAFGLRGKQDIQRAIEVRMSNQNIPLQEKRFALIRSILVGVGVNDAQILPYMTDRTPHTIVLRSLDLPEEGLSTYTTNIDGLKEQMYYRQW